jgi:hypothetical protein
VNRIQQRRFAEVRPRVYEDGDSVTLQFQIGEIQSEMLLSDPNSLVLSYTRTMMAFQHFHEAPERIAIIGLGGGSMPKWCYQQLPATDITVIEISSMVISLRGQFYIPADHGRFRVICGDGADYVASTEDSPEVLLVDGFDIHGQPPQLCSQDFYEDCYRAIASDGAEIDAAGLAKLSKDRAEISCMGGGRIGVRQSQVLRLGTRLLGTRVLPARLLLLWFFQVDIGIMLDAPQLLRHVLWRKNEVRTPRIDGAARHSVVFGRGGVLGEGDPPSALNVLHAGRAIRSLAGKNDGNCAAFALLGKGVHEEIHRQMLARRFAAR